MVSEASPRPPVHRFETRRFDLAVLGGGAGGISAARAGARRRIATVLVQDGPVGGDCTFTGCVPSKALIEAAEQGRSFTDAVATMRAVVDAIADAESADVLRGEGIEIVQARARFVAPRTVDAGGSSISARRFVIATGSSPVIPPVPGLDSVPHLTNENVFDLASLPSSLAVLGGGAIGCELAQTFRRFGAEVSIFEAAERLLPREEPEASQVLADFLSAEGVKLHLSAKVTAVSGGGDRSGVRIEVNGDTVHSAEKILIAVGRRPSTQGLDAETGGVRLDDRGYIATDRYLATSAPGTYAIGDVTGWMLFTHAADEMGRLAVRNAFGRLGRSSFDTSAIPWVTFTNPEVARVGVSEADAPPGSRVAFLPMASVDRAVAAGRTEGFVKLIAAPRNLLRGLGGGRIVGATVVAPRAGEMIHEVSLAVRTGMFTGRLAQAVHAYPSWSTAIRQAAAQFFMEVDGRRAFTAGRFGKGRSL